MYCPICTGQAELVTAARHLTCGARAREAICPTCSFALRAPTDAQLQDMASTLWCYLPSSSAASVHANFDRLTQFVQRLETASPAGLFDALYLEINETGGTLSEPQGNQLRWMLKLHGYRAYGDSEQHVIENWRAQVAKYAAHATTEGVA